MLMSTLQPSQRATIKVPPSSEETVVTIVYSHPIGQSARIGFDAKRNVDIQVHKKGKAA